ncbi:MAG: hypothetical protein FWH25_02715 [Syntrophorhabdaceae bacterium]|nr:hypothetical protein [Syntrophorhabdaceae bacterium]
MAEVALEVEAEVAEVAPEAEVAEVVEVEVVPEAAAADRLLFYGSVLGRSGVSVVDAGPVFVCPKFIWNNRRERAIPSCASIGAAECAAS